MFESLCEFIDSGPYDDRPYHDYVFIFNMGSGENIIRTWGPYSLEDLKVVSSRHLFDRIAYRDPSGKGLPDKTFYAGEGVMGWVYWIKDTPFDIHSLTRILIPKTRG